MTNTKTTPLQDLIDLCVQAEQADGKVVPILPSTFFVECAFALSKYKDLLDGSDPEKKIVPSHDYFPNAPEAYRFVKSNPLTVLEWQKEKL